MILQSECGVVSRREEALPAFGEGNGAVVRLEFKAMEVPRSREARRIWSTSQEPEPVMAEAKQSVAFERQRRWEQEKIAGDLESAREAGRTKGLEEAAVEYEERIAAERVRVLQVSKAFLREREKYFAEAKLEVVKSSTRDCGARVAPRSRAGPDAAAGSG